MFSTGGAGHQICVFNASINEGKLLDKKYALHMRDNPNPQSILIHTLHFVYLACTSVVDALVIYASHTFTIV